MPKAAIEICRNQQDSAPDSGQVHARVKRFLECWTGDDRFRAALEADPDEAVRTRDLDLDPWALAFVWKPSVASDPRSPEARAIRCIYRRMHAFLEFCANDEGSTDAYRSWRARQIARTAFARGPTFAPISLHLPFAVELTRGCSLGCWFCALSASRLEETLEFDLSTWEAMLLALRGLFGESACRGFLYWATDPLDHPRYEAYAEAFRKVLGRFPMTTTAVAVRDLDRARRLISLAVRGASPALRFSVVTRRNLDTLHAAFSAEELAAVDLVMANRESVLALAEAGHARRRFRTNSEQADTQRAKLDRLARIDDCETLSHNTIACVSGFLIQPLEHRIRLISPEPASDRWPDGFVVFDEVEFDAGEGFDASLESLATRNFADSLPAELAVQRGVSLNVSSGGKVVATGNGHRLEVPLDPRAEDYPVRLAEAFLGGASVRDVTSTMSAVFTVAHPKVRHDIATLWRAGVLIETFFSFADVQRDAGTPSSRTAVP
jgi:radical SAM family RiPP maturation amino acid epimerase